MIIELNTKLLDLPVEITLNQLVLLSMVLDKNQRKIRNQDVRKLLSLLDDDDIPDLMNKDLIALIEKDGKITINSTKKLRDLMEPPSSNFDRFYELYPVYILRPDGTKQFLRGNINKCRNMYNTITKNNETMIDTLYECLKFEIDKKMRTGKMMYMKTMWKWLTSAQWEESEAELENQKKEAEESYGTDII